MKGAVKMAGGRPRKDYVQFNMKMDREIMDRLVAHADAMGQTKTKCVELIITKYLDEYEKNHPQKEKEVMK